MDAIFLVRRVLQKIRVDVMDRIFDNLYNIYSDTLSDLTIGYPLSNKNVDEMWDIIYDLYFTEHIYDRNKDLSFILEYYEYL